MDLGFKQLKAKIKKNSDQLNIFTPLLFCFVINWIPIYRTEHLFTSKDCLLNVDTCSHLISNPWYIWWHMDIRQSLNEKGSSNSNDLELIRGLYIL